MRRWFLKVHRWAGLAAGAWLLVLGLTGVVLDHPEWRWVWHATVPKEWLSAEVGRLLRGTVMRYVVADPAQPSSMIGGSERGLWWTASAGREWQPVAFQGIDGAPQVLALVPGPAGGPANAWIATDDGLWRTDATGRSAQPVAFRGAYLNSLTPGSTAGELVAVRDNGVILRFDVARPEASVRSVPLDDVEVSGLPGQVGLYGFIFDLHFGEALLQRAAAIRVNDLAAAALVVLPVTGLFYWWLPLRWRRARATGGQARARRSAMDWLYRFHAPVIGVLAAVPILYVAVTGGLLTHPQWLERLTQDVQLRREQLLWTYRFESLRDEVTHVVAYPGEPRRLSIATRLGVLHSGDGGRSWRRDPALAPKAHNLFREGDTVFASPLDRVHWYRRDGADDWRAFTGPVTAITDAARTRDGWLVKNSRSLWSGAPDSGFRPISVPYPPADGATAFLFAVDIHTGYVIHRYFKWVNVAAASLVVLLLVTGPVLWWRAKWR